MPNSESLAEAPDTEVTDVNGTNAKASPAEENDGTADSSPVDQDSKGPDSVLDAINKALEEPKEPEDSSTSTDGEDSPAKGESEEESEEDELSEEISDEELKGYPDKTRKRIETLLDKVKTASTERDQYRDGHERFVAIQQFAEGNNLGSEELKKGFTIMALMKNDPIEAYNQLKPYMDTLEGIIGVKLPPALQSQVDDGLITVEHAQQLARSQSEAAIAQQQLRQAGEAAAKRDAITQQKAQEEQHRALTNAVVDATAKWEANWRKTDPDYKVKQQFVQNAIAAKLAAGYKLTSPQDAVKLAEDCKAEVDAAYKKAQPRSSGSPDEIVQSDASVKKTTVPKPKSTMDVIDGVLSGS